jgi:ABC-type nitrate/sulfonate/bicarbonate transport system substrate-binding protein
MVLYGHNTYNWCFYAAQDQGYFERENLTISEPLMVNTDADANRAMLSGEGDVSTATVGMLQAIEPGSTPGVQFIAGTGAAAYSFVGPSDIEDLAGLEGATIALPPEGQPSADVAVATLNEVIGEDAWTPLHIGGGSGARIAALEAGQAQGAFMAAPFDAAIAQEGQFHVIDYLADYSDDYQIGVIMASTQWLEESPDVAARWVRAYVDGCEWLYDPANEQRAIELMAEKVETTPEAVQETYDVYIAGDLSGTTPPEDGAIDVEALENVATLMEERGSLEGPIDPLIDALVNEDVYQQATQG